MSGVGDDAIAMSLGPLTTLFVKKGSVTFMVRVYGVPDPTKQLAIEKPIAQAVANHLSACGYSKTMTNERRAPFACLHEAAWRPFHDYVDMGNVRSRRREYSRASVSE